MTFPGSIMDAQQRIPTDSASSVTMIDMRHPADYSFTSSPKQHVGLKYVSDILEARYVRDHTVWLRFNDGTAGLFEVGSDHLA